MEASAAPILLRRGLQIFAVISVVVFGGMLLYGSDLDRFLAAMVSLHWPWVVLGLLVASLDWFGGGLRLYVLARHVHPGTTMRGCVMSAGLNMWATQLTPSQAGGGPVGIYVLSRYGTPLPEAVVVTFMSFVATVLFFLVAGPVALVLGAGQSLEQHDIFGAGVTLQDLFRMSLGGFMTVGLLMLLVMLFPGVARRVAQAAAVLLERRGSRRLAKLTARLRDGIDRAHEAVVAYYRGAGWLALLGAVVTTGATLANKLLAGYIVLRALGIQAPFVDVLLLQTLIVFLLYFAPTPGGSGLAEVLSVAVMSIYVPRELTPSYVLLWRLLVGYLTVGVGSAIFWRWLGTVPGRIGEGNGPGTAS